MRGVKRARADEETKDSDVEETQPPPARAGPKRAKRVQRRPNPLSTTTVVDWHSPYTRTALQAMRDRVRLFHAKIAGSIEALYPPREANGSSVNWLYKSADAWLRRLIMRIDREARWLFGTVATMMEKPLLTSYLKKAKCEALLSALQIGISPRAKTVTMAHICTCAGAVRRFHTDVHAVVPPAAWDAVVAILASWAGVFEKGRRLERGSFAEFITREVRTHAPALWATELRTYVIQNIAQTQWLRLAEAVKCHVGTLTATPVVVVDLQQTVLRRLKEKLDVVSASTAQHQNRMLVDHEQRGVIEEWTPYRCRVAGKDFYPTELEDEVVAFQDPVTGKQQVVKVDLRLKSPTWVHTSQTVPPKRHYLEPGFGWEKREFIYLHVRAMARYFPTDLLPDVLLELVLSFVTADVYVINDLRAVGYWPQPVDAWLSLVGGIDWSNNNNGGSGDGGGGSATPAVIC